MRRILRVRVREDWFEVWGVRRMGCCFLVYPDFHMRGEKGRKIGISHNKFVDEVDSTMSS